MCKNLSRIWQPPCSMKGLAINGAGDDGDGSSSTLSRVSGGEAWLK